MNHSQSSCVKDHQSGFVAFKNRCFQLEILYFISGWHKKSLTGIIATDIIIVIPTVIFNLLVVYVVWKYRSLQTASNLLLASLAVSDFFIGLALQPCKIISTILVLNCQSVCWLLATVFQLGYYLATVSFLTLTEVSIDRFIALAYPFRYQRLTSSNTFIHRVIFATWILPLLVVILSTAVGQMRIPSLLFTIIAPLSITCSIIAQISTIRVVRRARKRDRSLSVNKTNPDSRRNRRRNYAPEKATRVAGLVLLATIGCYAPHAVLTAIRMVRKDIRAFQGIYDWTKTLVILNSTLNPVIYCWILKEMRRRIFQTMFRHRLWRRSSLIRPKPSGLTTIEMRTNHVTNM